MIKLLIVDDSAEKRSHIISQIRELPDVGTLAITEAVSSIEAKVKMLDTRYDLAIIDVQLPKREGQKPEPLGGVELTSCVLQSPRFKAPLHIIATTAYEESQKDAQDLFIDQNVILIRYDRSSATWAQPIINKIEQLLNTESKSLQLYQYDFAVICALRDPELDAILTLDYAWEVRFLDGDSTEYFTGTIKFGEMSKTIVAMAAPQMGMAATAVLSARMIQHFRPRYMFMAGIAAGVRGETNYGDVLIADPSFDHNSGKLKATADGTQFHPDPLPLRLSTKLANVVRNIAQDQKVLNKIYHEWKADKPHSLLRVKIGPFATGSTVLAADGILDNTVSHWRKLIGLDLETYGLFCAAEYFGPPKPMVLSVKSVTDFADSQKDDRWRKYAAYTSSMITSHVIDKLISIDGSSGSYA